ncbi:fimbrillin family protein [Segatella copri]|uniref:fimbrillin family protein n=1 Tax=Segatella copri TaxID=165179 RepID=UPI00294B83F4|nr:fimbrillin family protein [Segatella copri]
MDKKFVMGIAAMAALTLVSCSSDDLDSVSDNSSKNEAISFDGYLGRSAVAVNGTRGSVETKETLIGSDKGFGVFGYYNSSASDHNSTSEQTFDANLFINQRVFCPSTGANAKWTYSPLKFWPTQGHIDFLAYAPYDSNTALKKTTETEPKNTSCIDFNVDKDIANQKDLLWANATGKITTDLACTKEKVKFHFYHALSRLGYNVTLSGDYSSSGATFTVNKITLAGSSDGKTKNAFYKTGTIDLSKANKAEDLWNTSSKSNDAKQNFDLVSSDQVLGKDGIKSGDNYLFVIPQDFSGADELYVYVEYTIDYGGKTGSVKNTVYKQIKKHFLQGTAYMLNLTIGLPIEFDVDVTNGVEGWGDDEKINIGSNDTPWDR